MSPLFASDNQNTGVSASASVLPMSIQGWFPLRLTGLILLCMGLSRVFSGVTVWRHQLFGAPPSLWCGSHNHIRPLGRPQPWLYRPLSVMSLLFNTLSRFVIAFLPKSKCLLISWLQSAVILESKKRKSVTTSTSPASIHHEIMGPEAMILAFLIFSFKMAHKSCSVKGYETQNMTSEPRGINVNDFYPS